MTKARAGAIVIGSALSVFGCDSQDEAPASAPEPAVEAEPEASPPQPGDAKKSITDKETGGPSRPDSRDGKGEGSLDDPLGAHGSDRLGAVSLPEADACIQACENEKAKVKSGASAIDCRERCRTQCLAQCDAKSGATLQAACRKECEEMQVGAAR